MSTSLFEQLQRLKAPQTGAIADPKRRASILFEAKEAASKDRRTIYDLGIHGLQELIVLNPSFQQFEETLFDENTLHMERAVENEQINDLLNMNIRKFFRHLSPYFLLRPAHLCLEWLIRRFQVHDYNRYDLIALVLPYHETNAFVKVIQTFRLKSSDKEWFWLKPLQKPGKPLAKSVIVNRAATDNSFFHIVCKTTLAAIKELGPHAHLLQAQINFYGSVVVGALETTSSIREGHITTLLPSLLKGLTSDTIDFVSAAYIITARLVARTQVVPKLCNALIARVAKVKFDRLQRTALLLLIWILDTQKEESRTLQEETLLHLVQQKWLLPTLATLAEENVDIKSLIIPIIEGCTRLIFSKHSEAGVLTKFLENVLNEIKFPSNTAQKVISTFLDSFVSDEEKPAASPNSSLQDDDIIELNSDEDEEMPSVKTAKLQAWYSDYLQQLERQYPTPFDLTIKESLSNPKLKESADRSKVLKIALGYRLQSTDSATCGIYENLYHHTASIRLMAIKSLLKNIKDYQKRPQNYQLLKECLADRIADDSEEIVKEILKLPTSEIMDIMGCAKFVEALIAILYKMQMKPQQWGTLAPKVVKHLTSEQVICEYDNNLILLALMPLLFPNDSEATFSKALTEIIKSPLSEKIPFLQNLQIQEKYNIADFKRHFLDVISDNLQIPSVVALFESVESQGVDYFKQAMQLYHFLMLITACLKGTYPANHSLQIFKQISGYTRKFQIKHLEKEQWKEFNKLRYIPLQLFCDFLLALTRHTIFENLEKSSWEDSSAVELHYFLKVFEFVAQECFSKPKNSAEQTEWAKLLKELFDGVFKDTSSKIEFLVNFYVYDDHAAVGNYAALRMQAFKIIQALLTGNNKRKCKLNSEQILRMTIGLLSNSQTTRMETLASLKPLLHEDMKLDEATKFFVKSILERSEEISMDCEQFPLVLYALLKGEDNKRHVGIKFLKEILNLLKRNVKLDQSQFTKQLLNLVVHINDENIVNELVPLAERALQLYTMDNAIKLLKDPYANIYRMVIERFNDQNIENVLTDNPKAWKLIETIFESNMVFLTAGDSLKPATCVFLETLNESALKMMPHKHKQQFLLLIIKTLAECENDTIFLAANKLLRKSFVDCKDLKVIIENMYKSCVESSKQVSNRKTLGKRESTLPPQVQVNALSWKKGVVLMELLENKKRLENTTLLIPALFELLNCCLAVEEQTTVEYTKQLVLSALLHCCQKATEDGFQLQAVLPKATFRVDQIVQCLRASQNPQTHHNALLLLSHCAALFPQQVLHNIVGIFTFMGSSVVRHDDAFSFHIINDIIVSIVPILVKEKATVIPVLKVFSDIMLDVPEHRRLPLYTKLLQTLGSEQYLWMFLCVVFEAHVIDDEKQRLLQKQSKKTTTTGSSTEQVAKRIEIVLELTNTFAPEIVLETCILMLKYIEQLPMQKEGKSARKSLTSADNTEKYLFDINVRSAKQLRHYKYVIMQFLSAITSSNEFLSKIALLTDEEVVQMKPFYQNIIIRILSYVPLVSTAIEKAEETSQQKFWKVILHHLHDVLDNAISLLSAQMFLVVVNGLMQHSLLSIRKKVIELLINKLQQKDDFFETVDSKHFHSLLKLLSDIIGGILEKDRSVESTQQNELVFLQQTALIAIKLLSKQFAFKHIPEFKEILTTLTKISKQRSYISKIVLATVVLTMIEISSNLKAHSIAHLPKFMPQLIEILQDQSELVRHQTPDNVCVAIVTGMHKLFEALPLFLGPHTVDIITALSSIGTRITAQNNEKDQRSTSVLQKINTIWSKIATDVPLRILVPSCDTAYSKLMATKNYADISVLMKLLNQAIKNAGNKDLNAVLTELTGIFMQAVEFRLKLKTSNLEPEVIYITESAIIEAFVSWVLKLSESSFRPLYHKLYNWALNQSQQNEAILTYFLLTQKIAESLKSLFVLFASDFIEDAARLLNECNANKTDIESDAEPLTSELLKAVLNTLYNIFLHDSKEFVNAQRFEYLMPAIVDQLENRLVLERDDLQLILCKCIAQLAVDVSNDVLWKQLNYQVLLKTRTSVPEVRIFAFNCCVEIARKLGDDFTPLLPETVPFIAELFEDENPRVEKNTRKSVQELEVVLGESLQKYL